ncbi:MAG: tRNA pseudouridine(55) synthase TruB [Candidatus Moraniibacteriota bacterium]|nr:MAG: tRNA pseudouridine(55) synthase TruB [Candidatus Moranbacteria bacterium]
MKNTKGLYVINKPYGISSQHAVQIVKYWAWRKTGDKKIKVGHGGTLDPLATGVLVVAVGREYTKNIDKIVASEKEYVAEIFLGEVSETDDAEGRKSVVNKEIIPTSENIKKAVNSFVGEIAQMPPVYSAIKIDGQEAYKRVRRGEDIQMKSRKIHIHKIEVISYEYPIVKIRVICGKGTYIRSLARDIGKKIGTGAYLASLVRMRVGNFSIENARNIDMFRTRVAVHAAELDADRIDGTRVYIKEIFARIGALAKDDVFTIYHQGVFNKYLTPPKRKNYILKKCAHVPFWTQTRFAWNIFLDKPDIVWIPLHNAPLFCRKNTKVVITIHDLAFKKFPHTFPKRDVYKLHFLTKIAVYRADHIITVSQSTKEDLLAYYPYIKEEDVTVVYHGIDNEFWKKESTSERILQILHMYGIQSEKYIIHTGAIQPRKNLKRLIDAFEKIKKDYVDMKLVLVGGRGWLWEGIEEYAKKSRYNNDIIFTGNISFEHVRILMQNAKIFVFPSLYEGFGLPGIEAMATGIPVLAADNSSISEVLGSAAIYFDENSSDAIAKAIDDVLCDEDLQQQMQKNGYKRSKEFTWDESAKRTLTVLRKI